MIHSLSLALLAIYFIIPIMSRLSSCESSQLDNFQLHLPKGSKLAIPKGAKIKYLTVGEGVQNYVCDKTTGKWTSIGAVSKLYDLSSKPSEVDKIINDRNRGGNSKLPRPSLDGFPQIGNHFFANGADNKLIPTFVVNNQKYTAKKDFNATAPGAQSHGHRNVDWLQLSVTSGPKDVTTIFRTTTRGGKPPAVTCKPGEKGVSSTYAALYSFYG